jgi:glycosyltransferase involved in cell wall biosynthesis
MARISIIIPAHNPGAYLRKAVQSIYAQTYTDWELVVVDDNSTEDLSWLEREFPKARLIRQRHGGASVARNNGGVLYRKHDNNFSDQYEVGRREVDAMVARYVAYARSKGDVALAKAARTLFGRPRRMYAAQAFDCARRSLRAKEYKVVARHLGKAFWFSPAFVIRSLSRWFIERLPGRAAAN